LLLKVILWFNLQVTYFWVNLNLQDTLCQRQPAVSYAKPHSSNSTPSHNPSTQAAQPHSHLYPASSPTQQESYCSDFACESHAKALLSNLKDPQESLTIQSTLIDYGSTPILAGDKLQVTLPIEGVNSDFRVLSVEYNVLRKNPNIRNHTGVGPRETFACRLRVRAPDQNRQVKSNQKIKVGKKKLMLNFVVFSSFSLHLSRAIFIIEQQYPFNIRDEGQI
jgi:hypothetical protein